MAYTYLVQAAYQQVQAVFLQMVPPSLPSCRLSQQVIPLQGCLCLMCLQLAQGAGDAQQWLGPAGHDPGHVRQAAIEQGEKVRRT
jgi:hypothetical protein